MPSTLDTERAIPANSPSQVVPCRGKRLDLTRTAVMGILNITPDSFSDGGRFFAKDKAIDHALHMHEAGAAIIDIGGESTRPRAEEVSVDDELDRVIPVIEAIRSRVDAVISIDSSKARVMREAVEAGADMINDVCALGEAGSMESARDLGTAVCLMHMQGNPRTMQARPSYRDVVSEVRDFLANRVRECVEAGIPREKILVDPGFGFGKTLEHNMALLRGLSTLCTLGLPVVAGLSRKSFVGKIVGNDMDDRVYGSVAFALAAVRQGASVVRVHDVKPTVDALKVWHKVYG